MKSESKFPYFISVKITILASWYFVTHWCMWTQNWWKVTTTVQEMQCWHSVSCKMATFLNELTKKREKVHTNNPIPAGTKHGTHEHPQTECGCL